LALLAVVSLLLLVLFLVPVVLLFFLLLLVLALLLFVLQVLFLLLLVLLLAVLRLLLVLLLLVVILLLISNEDLPALRPRHDRRRADVAGVGRLQPVLDLRPRLQLHLGALLVDERRQLQQVQVRQRPRGAELGRSELVGQVGAVGQGRA